MGFEFGQRDRAGSAPSQEVAEARHVRHRGLFERLLAHDTSTVGLLPVESLMFDRASLLVRAFVHHLLHSFAGTTPVGEHSAQVADRRRAFAREDADLTIATGSSSASRRSLDAVEFHRAEMIGLQGFVIDARRRA